MPTLGFQTHDHGACIADTVAAAEAACAARGVRFTPVRRRVLEILLDGHRALGAYDILDVLHAEGLGSQPPVVYRALEFLVAQDFAHRIERLNAFVSCSHPSHEHSPAFLICRACDQVAETDCTTQDGAVGQAAEAAGFAIERAVVEVEGLCPKCQNTPQP